MAADGTGGHRGRTRRDNRAFTKQPQIVEIKADDGSFKTTGCQTWTLTNQPPPAPGMSPVLAALQWKLYMDTLNRNAAQYEAKPRNLRPRRQPRPDPRFPATARLRAPTTEPVALLFFDGCRLSGRWGAVRPVSARNRK